MNMHQLTRIFIHRAHARLGSSHANAEHVFVLSTGHANASARHYTVC